MKLNTKHFGEIEINEEEILFFPDGILAFEEYKKFIILDTTDKDNPFQWLQCVDHPNLAFVIINPFLFKKDYEFDIPQSVIDKLEIEKTEDVVVYTIVVVPDDIKKMTANLSGPLIINASSSLQNTTTSINTTFKSIEMDGFPPFLGIYIIRNC